MFFTVDTIAPGFVSYKVKQMEVSNESSRGQILLLSAACGLNLVVCRKCMAEIRNHMSGFQLLLDAQRHDECLKCVGKSCVCKRLVSLKDTLKKNVVD